MSSLHGCKENKGCFPIEFLHSTVSLHKFEGYILADKRLKKFLSNEPSGKIQKEKTMKPILIILLALILVACGVPPAPIQQPTAAPPEPTQTPVVVVQTVVVEATQAATEVPPTPVPPTVAAVVVTVVVEPTQAAATNAPAVVAPTEASGGPITVDDALGAGWFVSMTRNRNDFSLRCQLNKEITFSTKATSPDITQVDLWYRIEDRDTGAIFDWQNAGRMVPDNTGGFTTVFSGEEVSANFRKPNAWFDYQFVGYNPTGVIGRSEKIERQVAYTFDCP
jgi:hypothetical protein